MPKIIGPLDGKVSNYAFGPRDMYEAWRIAAPSLRRAIRLFRVGALFPEKYIDKKTGLIPIWAKVDQNYTEVIQIPVEGQEDLDPRSLSLLGSTDMPGQEVSTSALSVGGATSGLRTAVRSELEDKTRDMNTQLAALEAKKQELEQLKREVHEELTRRMEQIWVIELFLGSHEEVTVLCEGKPAPIDTPIAVRQAVLCMDEEIAVHDWLHNPDRIGMFDYQSIESFDRWLVERPEALESICPWKKGIVGLRIRRKRLDRGPSSGIFEAICQQEQEDADRMTYLLIRNGERLFRLWIDVNLWPRLFPSLNDTETATNAKGRRLDNVWAQALIKQQIAGLIAVQGILERSELLHPVPADINIFKSDSDGEFVFVRDDEETLALRDDSNPFSKISWKDIYVKDPSLEDQHARILAVKGYKTWLREQLDVGVRVLYTGSRHNTTDDKLEDRTDIRSLSAWPKHGEVYTLSANHERSWRGPLEFLYRPDQSVYVEVPDSPWRGDYQKQERRRRVSFRCYPEEVVPFDFLSWRVLEHLIKDRSQREHYGDFFRTAFNWWRIAKAEAERERPFIDLVLSRCGVDLFDEKERARCERLLRWWKIKTKEHRTLGTDEAKALRMIEAAFKRGDDHDNDPEAKLLSSKS